MDELRTYRTVSQAQQDARFRAGVRQNKERERDANRDEGDAPKEPSIAHDRTKLVHPFHRRFARFRLEDSRQRSPEERFPLGSGHLSQVGQVRVQERVQQDVGDVAEPSPDCGESATGKTPSTDLACLARVRACVRAEHEWNRNRVG